MNRKTVLLGVFALGLGALSFYGYKQYKAVKGVKFEVIGYQIKSINLQQTVLDLTLAFTNTTDLGFDVTSYSFDIRGNEKYVGSSDSKELITVDANKVNTLKAEVVIPNKIALQSASKSIGESGLKNVLITIKGGVNVKKGILPFYIPINYSFKISDLE